MRESGEIAFVQGQVTQASSGPMNGWQALNWLKAWGACRFTFTPEVAEYSIQPQPASLSRQLTQPLNALHPSQSMPSGATWSREGAITGELPVSSSATASTPRRLQVGEEMLHLLEQAGLSRLHRRIFLLIDGKRSSAELIRLIGRSQDEVQRLLDDLERIGIIQQ
jgi:hypothetical protein